MSPIGDKKDPQVPHGKLEEWLQLPEGDGDAQPGALEEFPEDPDSPEVITEAPADSEMIEEPDEDLADEDQLEEEQSGISEEPVVPECMSLFPDYGDETAEPPDEIAADVPSDSDINDITADSEIAESIGQIEELEEILVREFSDTLTGPNAVTLPLGLFFLLLSVTGWFLHPLIDLLGLTQLPFITYLIVLPVSAALTLAGIHLVFYWAVHRISNGVKSRELDRLIEERREKYTCRYLDCTETEETHGEDETEAVEEEILSGSEETADSGLVWECSLFHIDLEDLPVCAVCDRYEPFPPTDHEITIDRESG